MSLKTSKYLIKDPNRFLASKTRYQEKPSAMIKRHGLKEFEDLQTSTMTVMIYTNLIFDMPKIFDHVELTEVDVPLTKKQKNVDKKKIFAPYGSIISVQSKTKIRGIDLRKKKKHWCTICQPYKIIDDKEVKIITVTEQLVPCSSKKNEDTYAIMYFCSRCHKQYRPEEMKKINHFLNQLTAVLSIGKQPLLNIMMFKDNLKIAGCKTVDDAVEAVMVFWQDYILHIPDSWQLKKGATDPRFVFEVVMRNVDFKLGFPIERPALNYLMNGERYQDKIFMSQYESTGHTNVNIKMFSKKPVDFKYDCLVMPLDHCQPHFIKMDTIPYKSLKKREKEATKQKYITFIVFSSSEIILSGRYDLNMKEMYEFFVKTVFEHRKSIEEKLDNLDEREVRKIKKQNTTQ